MWKRKIVVDDKALTEGAGLTLRQSLLPCGLGTIL
jgi:FHS family L-fucose permease-like MFS transporter